jgi:hypothetical protein
VEEEEYATRFIHYFSSGLLTLPDGKTLRASLAEKLHCDPMRITKKYAGASCLGSKISKLSERPTFSPRDVEMARLEIARLDRRFHDRLARGVGVPLPPDDGGAESPNNIESQHVAPADHPPSYPPPGDAAQNISRLHRNTSNNRPNSSNNGSPSTFIRQVVAPDALRSAATSLIQPAMPQQMAMPPAASSYLATVAVNPQLAAATMTPNNIAHISVAAPVSASPTHAVVQHQINAQLGSNPQPVAQQAATMPAMNWPTMFQGANQVCVNNATAR